MADDESSDAANAGFEKPAQKKTVKQSRDERIKASLRANLHRRKQKARALRALENEDPSKPTQ